ncbi:MAG: cell division protein, partial [Alistipes sp.]|nr:cell division protein [Alistipes sp.]
MKDDKRLKRKVRNSYLVATVSITLVLFLLGSVGYLMLAAMEVARTLQSSIQVSVELKNNITDAQRQAIEKRLDDQEPVAYTH